MARERERLRVPIDSEKPHVRAAREQRLRVAARPERRVHEEPAALRTQRLRDFPQEDGHVCGLLKSARRLPVLPHDSSFESSS